MLRIKHEGASTEKTSQNLNYYPVNSVYCDFKNLQMSAESPKKAAKAKKPAAEKSADHPKYIDMIKAAMTALKQRNGSSRQAIVKYIKANYKVANSTDVHVKMVLKRGVAKGAIAQPKGRGALGSFKVGKKEPPDKMPKAKKPKTPMKAAPKKAAAKKPKKKSTPMKPAAKKSTVAKKKPAKKPAKEPAKKPAA